MPEIPKCGRDTRTKDVHTAYLFSHFLGLHVIDLIFYIFIYLVDYLARELSSMYICIVLYNFYIE